MLAARLRRRRHRLRDGAPVRRVRIFRAYREGTTGPAKASRSSRALGELKIDIICANTPQAKGRVEHMHQTLQNRLVKELRLRGISTMADRNASLPEFTDDYNRRLGRPPRDAHDAHRPLRPDEDLDRIFTWQVKRTLSRNLVVHFERATYLVEPGPGPLPLGCQKVRVFQWEDGRVQLRCGGRDLPYSVFDDRVRRHPPGLDRREQAARRRPLDDPGAAGGARRGAARVEEADAAPEGAPARRSGEEGARPRSAKEVRPARRNCSVTLNGAAGRSGTRCRIVGHRRRALHLLWREIRDQSQPVQCR